MSITASGFPTLAVDNVLVSQGAVYTLVAKITISQLSTIVEVSADTLTLDTTTETQTILVTGSDLQAMPLNGRDFTQLIAVAPGFAGYSGGGFGSVNGTRPNQVNWQIDGVDNNDLWHNVPAVNQGGVLGIAGIVLPIDSIDQFSVQTQAAKVAKKKKRSFIRSSASRSDCRDWGPSLRLRIKQPPSTC